MILYYILLFFGIRAAQLLWRNKLVTTAGINLSDPSYDSGAESAPYMVTTDSGGNIVEDGNGNELSSSVLGLSGLTIADQWALSTSFSGDADPIINLDRTSTTGFDRIGSGVSESSGIFTFLSTGYYLILATAAMENNDDDALITLTTFVTQDNGTNWDLGNYARGSIVQAQSTNTWQQVGPSPYLFRVSDVSNDKVKFRMQVSNAATETKGSSASNTTNFTFLRLGDI